MGTREEYVTVLNSQNKMSNAEGQKFHQYLSSLIASIGAAVIGATLAWTSPMIPILENVNSSSPVHSTPEENAWVASLVPVGAIIGALPAGVVANTIGRKFTMIVFAVPWIISWVLVLLAQNVTLLYISRFLSGIITGVVSTVSPMYVTEIAEVSIRGSLGSYFQLFMTIGILFTYVFGATESYYILAAACLGLSVVFLVGVLIIPESHVHLVRKGRITSAEKSLQRHRGVNYNTQSEISEMRKTVENSSQEKFNLKVLCKKANIKSMLVSFGVMICQQASGINAVIFFSATIFENAGCSLSSTRSSVILGVVQVIATFCGGFLMDRAGRKVLLLFSVIVMGICHAVLGYNFWLKENGHDISSIGWVPLSSLLLFIVVFSIGLGPIPWMLAGEVFSPEIKGFATGVAVALNWIQTFLVTRFFRDVTVAIGSSYTFWIFAAICCIGTIFILLVVPETKGKTLQQIQNELAGNKSSSSRKYELNGA